MTIAPEEPKLQSTGNSKVKRLIEDHCTFVKIWFGRTLQIIIKKDYITDGATVPEILTQTKFHGRLVDISLKTKKSFTVDLYESLIGKSWDMPRLLAAIVHDALYDIHYVCRWLCDRIYRKILLQVNYERLRTDLEYTAIRISGKKNWSNISKIQQKKNRNLVSIKIVKTKKVADIINKLKTI